MTRWLGIDHGAKRIGIAVGNANDHIATPLAVVPAEPLPDAIEEILRLADEYRAVGIVVGWPVNMEDGTEGPQALSARKMAAMLAGKCTLDVRIWDERLSSFQADQLLAGTFTRKKKKSRQDAVAAAVILEDFLTRDGPTTAIRPDETAK